MKLHSFIVFFICFIIVLSVWQTVLGNNSQIISLVVFAPTKHKIMWKKNKNDTFENLALCVLAAIAFIFYSKLRVRLLAF